MKRAADVGTSPLARLRTMSLGSRVALVGAALTAVVVLIAFAVLRGATERNVRHAFVAELGASQRLLELGQAENQQLLSQSAALLSNSPTLKAALAAGHGESRDSALRATLVATVQGAATELFEDAGPALWVVTDDSGRVVAAAHSRGAPQTGASLLSLPALRAALDPVTPSLGAGVHEQAGTVMQVAAVPVVVSSVVVGAVVIGEPVTLPQPDTAVDIRGVVVAGGVALTSTVDGLRAGDHVPASWNAPRAADGELVLADQAYVAARLPLGRADNNVPAELIMLRSVSRAVDPILGALTRRFVLVGIAAVLLVGLGGALTTRLALQPLARFVAFMRGEAAATEFTQFSQTHAAAELTLLTRTYNQLIGSVQRGRAQLQSRTSELAAANELLQRQVDERERAERALRESEEALRQSQKLEALGSLAGGVAHDFNNILSIILGYAELVQMELPAEGPQHADLGKITDAAMRARALVRQLLAFSRKQVLQTQVLDLGQVVADVLPLLRPLVGDAIRLEVRRGTNLSAMLGDPSQIEQVLLNLVVNARDAMSHGGQITIETANVTLSEGSGKHPLADGPAVMLAVTDTGGGMDAETRGRIFEPFFTTKPVGKGTGLGLATVYGIVRQSEGNITVYSEPGQGATFRCYFPAAIAAGPVGASPASAAPDVQGAETILLVEDESELRTLMRRSLEGQGYVVLEAADGVAALEVARGFGGTIHLLLTDVVMPELSGTELAAALLEERPAMRVIFMSGYSDEAIERHGVLAPDSVFLQKPVSPAALSHTVRELLDERIGAEAG